MTTSDASLAYANRLREADLSAADDSELHHRHRRHGLTGKARHMASRVGEKAQGAASSATNYVHHNPYTAIGVAAGIGFVVGLILKRR